MDSFNLRFLQLCLLLTTVLFCVKILQIVNTISSNSLQFTQYVYNVLQCSEYDGRYFVCTLCTVFFQMNENILSKFISENSDRIVVTLNVTALQHSQFGTLNTVYIILKQHFRFVSFF